MVATAGHIDHGKTALVGALTGMETDRLAEERRRGITIELGFAFLSDDVTIIDVPGHERFIKTMTAGVSTVDLALLIVAADDAVMPQTREHLAILDLLGVPDLFVVITKSGGQKSDWLDLVEQEVLDLLPERFQQDASVFRCDSLSGQGIEELKGAILTYAETLESRNDSGVFRCPVDRAFTVKGYGTVVTGTVLGGRVKAGERLQIMPMGSEVRVRGLQSHGRDVPEAGVGVRAAMNLIGPEAGRIRRGDWVCARDAFLATDILDVKFATLPGAPLLKNRERIRLHIGTNETIGRLVLFGRDSVTPGGTCYAQVVLEDEIMATRSDRFVLRRYSPQETIGGGAVLDPVPVRKRRSDPEALESFRLLDGITDEETLEIKVRISGTTGLRTSFAKAFMNMPLLTFKEHIQRLKDEGKAVLFGSIENGFLAAADVVELAGEEIIGIINGYHHRFPQLMGIKQASLINELSGDFPAQVVEKALQDLVGGEIVMEKGYLRRVDHQIHLDENLEALSGRIERLLIGGGFNPPTVKSLQKSLKLSDAELNAVLDVMQQQERIVRMADGSPWAMEKVREAWGILRPLISGGQGRTMAELREALGCPRRFVVKFVEFLDREDLTERREDLRFQGSQFDGKLSFEE